MPAVQQLLSERLPAEDEARVHPSDLSYTQHYKEMLRHTQTHTEEEENQSVRKRDDDWTWCVFLWQNRVLTIGFRNDARVTQ